MLTDEHGRPLNNETTTEQPTEEKAAGNGKPKDPAKQDVRGLPTGTIIYNLIRVTNEEIGLEGFIHQMEDAKTAKKHVGPLPQLDRAIEVHQEMVRRRFVFANELNERFRHIDQARCAELGIEIFVPKGDGPPEPEPAEAQTPEGGD